MQRIKVQVTRSYVAALAAAWLLVLTSIPLRRPAFALAGILLGFVVLLGARPPPRPRLRAETTLSALTPIEEQPVEITVSLENTGQRAIFGQWRIDLPGPCSLDAGENAGYRFMAKKQRQEISMKVRFHLFGLQRIGPVHLRVEDPFGYTVLEGAFGALTPVRVYPRREPLRDPIVRSRQKRTNQGAYEVSQPGTGFEFFGLRGYSPGDRPRDVNWKASARTGEIVVNQHQKETDAELVLLLDIRHPTGIGKRTMTPFAQACRAALAIAEAHFMIRDSVRLVAYGTRIHEDRHTGATRRLQAILDEVIEMEPVGETPLGDVVKHILPSLRAQSPIILFSPLTGDPTIAPALSQLVSRGFPVRAIVPRASWTEAVPEPARLAWEASQELTLAALRRAGIPAALHRPGALLEQSLAQLEVASP